MIIFGLRTGAYKPAATSGNNCSYCQSGATVHLYFAVRYFHIFWIPIFPVGKTGISECAHCKQSLYKKQMPLNLQNQYNQASASAKIAVKYFTGLILAGLLVALVIVAVLFKTLAST